ncbi:hypothetical protein [Gordonia sp. (in: high G+C Gram-positive bacteria)]|uniref:hypothetical protein n=1 Tax=Gordonia sp. (in: high G+C Gram-positive bacteria) TaxID=84139 RepID=UPI0039E3FB4D
MSALDHRLPEPQPSVQAGLAAHKPGSVPLRPLRPADILSGSVGALGGNLGIVALAWAIVWVPAIAVAAAVFHVETTMGTVAISIAALVGPVVLTGLLAAPMHARATGTPMSFRTALGILGNRAVGLLTLDLVSAVLLAGPAIVVGFLLVWLVKGTVFSLLVLAQPFLLAAVVAVYLFLATPALLAQTVVAVEGGPLSRCVPRALGLFGRGALRQTVPTLFGALMLTSIAYAVFMLLAANSSFPPRLGMLVGAALVSPVVAGFAVMTYVDARIRQEAFDVELLAAEAAR